MAWLCVKVQDKVRHSVKIRVEGRRGMSDTDDGIDGCRITLLALVILGIRW